MYIQVVLPLKIPFEPTYEASTPLSAGTYVKVTFAGRQYIALVTAVDVPLEASGKKILPVDAVLDELPKEVPSTVALWRQMADYYMCTLGEVFKCARPVARLEDAFRVAERDAIQEEAEERKRQEKLAKLGDKLKALKEREDRKKEQLSKCREATREKNAKELTTIQESLRGTCRKIDELKTAKEESVEGSLALEINEFTDSRAGELKDILCSDKPTLWEGASLGTRVATFADLANRNLSEGKSTLILLPENFKTERMQVALKTYLPEVLFYGASTTAAQTRGILRRIQDGRPYVLAGSRSSMLLPHRDLGLIIVDDEHDGSYKQDSPAPRYNARDMAVLLGRMEGASVLLASQAPSLETLYNASCGKYNSLKEKEVTERCIVVDTFRELRKRGMVDILSRKLMEGIHRAVSDGRQSVIMVPAKSWSPLLRCPGCGALVKCPDCGGYLSVQETEKGRVMKCPQCGNAAPYTGRCDDCGKELKPVGAGIGRCSELIRSIWPEIRVAVIDADMTEKEQRGVLAEFSERKIDVLVGTQSVKKAFECDDIGCIGVLQADRWLTGDFRADEHAWQLFRGLQDMLAPGGVLVLQTKDWKYPVFRELDTEDLYASEDDAPAGPLVGSLLQERQFVGFPPYTRLIDVRVTDANEKRRGFLAGQLAAAIRYGLPGGVQVTGPFPKGGAQEENRVHIQVFLPRNREMAANKKALKGILEAFGKEKKYSESISIDVDPA